MKTVSKNNGSNPHAGIVTSQKPLRQAFDLCVRKTRSNIRRLADDPKSGAWAVDGNYFNFHEGFYDIGNWTSSFFTGQALMAWRETEDEYFLDQVRRLTPHYMAKVFTRHRDTHHDLGFLYSLYSVAIYKLIGDKVHHEIGLRAAEVLSRRFVPRGGFIRAWGHVDTEEHDNMAIIDCMMNLPLLYWASNETGQGKYRDIAIQHANTVLNNFIRADGSIYHAYRYDLKSGRPLGGDTYGGCRVESHWARGAAWGIYGFVLSYKHTKYPRYLDAAVRLAKKFVASLDKETVPLWDFKPASDSPLIRDASAAAIAICGFQELAKHHVADFEILKAKHALLDRLCSNDYLNFDENCPGIQKHGQVGDGRPGGAQNAYTSWGDYYLMEALARELFQFETWW